jgi:hypothetical protein
MWYTHTFKIAVTSLKRQLSDSWRTSSPFTHS